MDIETDSSTHGNCATNRLEPEDTTERLHSRRTSRAGLTAGSVALALGLVAVVLAVSWLAARPEPFDDAYIAFRYAENAVNGYGLVFNHGERVEGFSSPLFMALLILGGQLGISFEAVALAVNGLSMALVLLLAGAWARELCPASPIGSPPSTRQILVVVSGAWLWLALHPSSQLYLSSGMETWLFAALLLVFAFAVRQPPAVGLSPWRRPVLLGGIATLLALTRPEGLALVPLAALLSLVDAQPNASARMRAVAWSLAIPLAVLGCALGLRLWYYGVPLPNTYYAKIGSRSLGRWTRGIEYVVRETPWLVVPPLVFVIVAKVRSRQWLSLMGLWAFGVAFSLYAGGDWMPGSRFLVPSMVALAPIAGGLAAWSFTRVGGRRWLRRSAAVVLTLMLVAQALLAQLETIRLQRREADWIRSFAGVAQMIAGENARALVATGGIGIIAYKTGLEVLDVFGLTEPAIAAGGKWASRGTAGHQSYDGAYVWSRRPDLLLPHSVVSDAPLVRDRFLETVLTAPEPNRFWMREVKGMPGFASSYRYRVFEPTPGRFVGGFELVEPESAASDSAPP